MPLAAPSVRALPVFRMLELPVPVPDLPRAFGDIVADRLRTELS
jgi:hypothetical protein